VGTGSADLGPVRQGHGVCCLAGADMGPKAAGRQLMADKYGFTSQWGYLCELWILCRLSCYQWWLHCP
jgi:hypothetical protein